MINQQLGAITLSVPAAQSSNTAFTLEPGEPQIVARYLANSLKGIISIYRTIRRIDNRLEVQVVNVSPREFGERLAKGNGIVNYFNGKNPFTGYANNYVTPDNPFVWQNIGQADFMGVVAAVAMAEGTLRAAISVSRYETSSWKWDECTAKVLGACVRKRMWVEAEALMKSDWFLMVSGNETRRGTSVINTMQLDDGSTIASPSVFPALVTANKNLPCVTSGQKNCAIVTNRYFMKAAIGSEWQDNSAPQMWNQVQSSSGWTGLGIFIMVTVIAALTFIAGPIALGLANMANAFWIATATSGLIHLTQGNKVFNSNLVSTAKNDGYISPTKDEGKWDPRRQVETLWLQGVQENLTSPFAPGTTGQAPVMGNITGNCRRPMSALNGHKSTYGDHARGDCYGEVETGTQQVIRDIGSSMDSEVKTQNDTSTTKGKKGLSDIQNYQLGL